MVLKRFHLRDLHCTLLSGGRQRVFVSPGQCVASVAARAGLVPEVPLQQLCGLSRGWHDQHPVGSAVGERPQWKTSLVKRAFQPKVATECVKTKVFARETVSKAWWIISTMHIIASRCLAALLLLGLCYHPDNVFFLRRGHASEGWSQQSPLPPSP